MCVAFAVASLGLPGYGPFADWFVFVFFGFTVLPWCIVPTALLNITEERVTGTRFVRDNLAVLPAQPGEAFSRIEIDGRPAGDTRGADVRLLRCAVAVPQGRLLERIEWWWILGIRLGRTLYEVTRSTDEQAVRDAATCLAAAVSGPAREGAGGEAPAPKPAAELRAQRVERPPYDHDGMGSSVTYLLAVGTTPFWALTHASPSLALRVFVVVSTCAARASIGAFKLSRCPAARSKAFARVYKGCEPARPTPWLTPAVGTLLLVLAHLAAVAGIAAAWLFR
jgi:hypothetical protein